MKTKKLFTILLILFMLGFLIGQLFQISITSYDLKQRSLSWQKYKPVKCKTGKSTTSTTTRQPNHDEIMVPRVGYVTQVRPLFNFLKEPEINFNFTDSCLKTKEIDWHMVFFIKSAAENYVRRELLRRTWASLSYVNGARFYTVFVVGNPPDGNRELLNEESMRYRDILQYDGPDDYKNVVLKTLAGMQWSSSRLPSSAFYSSGDDDFLVNLLLLKQLVDDNIQTWHDKSWPEFPLVCSYGRLKAETPVRDKGYKCTMSVEEYKWPRYPKTCLGGLYTTSVNVIKQLFQIARTTKPIKLDDVWVTGLLRHKIGMPDEMVVENELNVAKHYSGFAKLETESKRDFMTKEWIPIFDSLKNASICRKL